MACIKKHHQLLDSQFTDLTAMQFLESSLKCSKLNLWQQFGKYFLTEPPSLLTGIHL